LKALIVFIGHPDPFNRPLIAITFIHQVNKSGKEIRLGGREEGATEFTEENEKEGEFTTDKHRLSGTVP